MLDFLTFNGWAFPDIPASARLVHALGRVPVPTADTGALFDDYAAGVAPMGTTGIMFAPTTYLGQSPAQQLKTRVLAVGIGISRAERLVYASDGAVAAAATVNLDAADGTNTDAGPDAVQGFREAVFSSNNGNFMLALGGAVVGYFGMTAGPLRLGRGYYGPGANYSITSMNAGVAAYAMYAVDDSPEAVYDTEVDVVRTSMAAGSGPQRFRPGVFGPTRPQLIDPGQEPNYVPVAPGNRAAFLDYNDGITIGVNRPVSSRLPATATLEARIAIALWSPGA